MPTLSSGKRPISGGDETQAKKPKHLVESDESDSD
jgi:hypothetical protein